MSMEDETTSASVSVLPVCLYRETVDTLCITDPKAINT